MNKRKSIWLKLVITDVILSVCIVANGYWYIQKSNPVSLLAAAIAGLSLIYCTYKYLRLLKKNKNVLR